MDDIIGIVTFANPNSWCMVDENTGEKREGNSIEYMLIDNLKSVTNEDGTKGTKIVKESLKPENIRNVTVVPAFYKLKFSMKNVKGKLQLKLDDVEFLQEV